MLVACSIVQEDEARIVVLLAGFWAEVVGYFMLHKFFDSLRRALHAVVACPSWSW